MFICEIGYGIPNRMLHSGILFWSSIWVSKYLKTHRITDIVVLPFDGDATCDIPIIISFQWSNVSQQYHNGKTQNKLGDIRCAWHYVATLKQCQNVSHRFVHS